ncbi:RNA 2',3'-cyclic phosphodiesterase [Piscinibacter sp.]|uniref:RNA 2',3'-cyclic phosphodiesterase n=1 Tax=Piscinibacter sp. TaxID=1903157 RepID=UPI002C45B4B5|nr:RNA 2',3'-cyclic phosphodiesterase [Albitalea sp.]HUG22466.1 RNA 2',3'-cyclic phosphodiesterase [Albitalea sp.]
MDTSENAEPLRLFVGLWPDDAVRDAVCAHQQRWTWPSRAVKVRRDKLHLTLHFLGAVPPDRVAGLAEALYGPFDPFELHLDRADIFRGGIAVLRTRSVPEALTALHQRLHRTLDALQMPSARAGLVPHVTLARKAQEALPPPEPPDIRWHVSGYVLVQSRPPAPYRIVNEYP